MRIRLPFFILLTACLVGCDLPPGERRTVEPAAQSEADAGFPLAGSIATAGRDRPPSSNIYLDLRDQAAMAGGAAKAVSLPTRHDINGDRRSDVGFVDTATGEFRYFAMDGARVIDDRRGYALPVGASVVSIGDFDGDRRADVLWENGSEVRLSRARPDGNLHPSEFVMAYARGWRIPGTGDLNNDGRHDIVWFNPDTGEVHYLFMRGSEWIAQQGGYFIPRGFDLLAVEDILKDGHADLILRRVKRVGGADIHIVYNGGFPVGFGSPQYSFSSGEPFAGSIDVNGDGDSDLLWHDPATGVLTIATCAGDACVFKGRYLEPGYRLRQLGDFNGDGRGDALWSDGVALVLAFGNALGRFDAPVVLTGHTPGWDVAGDIAFTDRPRSTAPQDIDGDHRSDLAWHDPATGALVYRTVNAATVGPERAGTTMPVGFRVVALRDFDGDGRADALWNDGDQLRLSRARPEGGFGASEFVMATPPAGWRLAGVADLDNNLTHDLVWFQASTAEVHYMLMDGSRILRQQGGVRLPAGSKLVALADTEYDGRADIVFNPPLPFPNDMRLFVAHNQGDDIVFRLPDHYNIPHGFIPQADGPGYRLAGVGDANGDRREDLVWLNRETGQVSVRLMACAAHCDGPLSATFTHRLRQTGDYDGDGLLDVLASAGSAVAVHLNQGPGAVALWSPGATLLPWEPLRHWLAGDAFPPAATRGDINADGRSDLLWFHAASGELRYQLLDFATIIGGRGGFIVPAGMRPRASGDFDGDGRHDVLLYGAGAGRILLAEVDGSFTLSPVVFTAPAGWEVAGTGDADADGFADIVLVNYALRETHVFYMQGVDVMAQAGTRYANAGTADRRDARIGAIADVDRDGDDDLVWVGAATVYVAGNGVRSLWRGDRRSGFRDSGATLPNIPGMAFVGASDYNGDGAADLVWHAPLGPGRSGQVHVVTLRGDDRATVTGSSTIDQVAYDHVIDSLADVSGDLRADFITSNEQQVHAWVGGPMAESPTVLGTIAPGWRIIGAHSPVRP